MSRPIPEGVPEDGIEAAKKFLEAHYADRDSEVALLNRKLIPLNSGEAYSSEVARLNQKPKGRFNINLKQLASDLKEQGKLDREMLTGDPSDKDALIRELVVTMEKIRSLSDSNSDPWDVLATIDTVSDEVIRKARTTCPEAFEP